MAVTRRSRFRLKRMAGVLAVLLIAAAVYLAYSEDWLPHHTPAQNENTTSAVSSEGRKRVSLPEFVPEEETLPWHMILVNAHHPVPEGYDIELAMVEGSHGIHALAYPYLEQMLDAARAEGLYPIVVSGFRTVHQQEKIMAQSIANYRAQGYSSDKAAELAASWVAQPGTSEHHLGLAVDINADPTRSTDRDVYLWLAENAHRFGFILRYPADKTEITGIDYEPWHYRYVGKVYAAEIYAQGVCLEEYLEAAE